MKKMRIKQISVLLIIILTLIPAGSVHAHKVIIFAWVEDGMIFSESHFGSKREAKNCNISVMNGEGELVLKGKSDNQGNYSFKIPENGAMTVVFKMSFSIIASSALVSVTSASFCARADSP